MIRNYLKIAIRNIFNQKIYSVINIFGLAIGITACIFVGLFIENDFSYDKHYENAENLHRVVVKRISSTGAITSAETPALVSPTLIDEFPDIKYSTRIYFSSNDLVQYGVTKHYEDHIAYADPDYLKMFTQPVVTGQRENLLLDKNEILITQSTASRYFGNENPVGKTLRVNNKYDFLIQAVIEDVNQNSHYTFDFLASYESLMDQSVGNYIPQWGATFGSYTYIMLKEGVHPELFEQKFSNLIVDKAGPIPGLEIKLMLQPVLDIHLYSNLEDEIQPNGSITFVAIMISIALFIMLLAGINFINLSTARAAKRAREIGVRKVIGALKTQIVKQFLSESILITMFALVLAILMVELTKSVFIDYTGIQVNLTYLAKPEHIISILLLTCLIGIGAGLYPALIVSNFTPVNALKANSSFKSGISSSLNLRKVLVVFQYSISLLLITATLVINDQVTFMRNFNMGFDKEHMLRFETPERIGDKYKTIKAELEKISGVKSSSACWGSPTSDNGFGTNMRPTIENNGEQISIGVRFVDHNYLKHFNVALVAGEPLNNYSENNYSGFMLVNESLVKKLGYTPHEAIGKSYSMGLNGYEPQIVGVVKNFNFKSLHENIEPNVFMYHPRFFNEIVLKVASKNISDTIIKVEKVWDDFYPEYPFKYSFIDEDIDKFYKSEEQSAKIIAAFSMVAIIIASLGLIGLTFYTTEDRKKEIGVRKVMGASITNITQNLTGEFLILILIATVISFPIGSYLMNNWLNQFPYQVGLNLFLFVFAALSVAAISLLVIGYSVIKSAVANPIDSLRSE